MNDGLKQQFRQIMKGAYLQCMSAHEREILLGSEPDEFDPFRRTMFENILGIFLMNSDAGFAHLSPEIRLQQLTLNLMQFTEQAFKVMNIKIAEEKIDAEKL